MNRMEISAFEADVIADGRITIPFRVRKKLHIAEGDLVICTIRKKGVAKDTQENAPKL